MIVYLNGATTRRKMPSLGWLRKCYQQIDRRYCKYKLKASLNKFYNVLISLTFILLPLTGTMYLLHKFHLLISQQVSIFRLIKLLFISLLYHIRHSPIIYILGKDGEFSTFPILLHSAFCFIYSAQLKKEMATHSSFLPGKFHGRRSLVGYSPWGRKESTTTEHIVLTIFCYL